MHLTPKYNPIYIVITFCCLLFCTQSKANTQAIEDSTTIKSYSVNYITRPLNIDGKLNDQAWKKAAWTDLFVDIEGRLFEPDWREVTLAAYSLSVKDAYEKWPMGTDGFVSTPESEKAIAVIHEMGLRAKNVGKTISFIKDYFK